MKFLYSPVEGLLISDLVEHGPISVPLSYTARLFNDIQSFLVNADGDDEYLSRLVLQLRLAIKENANCQPLFIDSLCVSLLLHLNASQPGVRFATSSGKLSSSQLFAICEYIHSRLDENISMKDLCGVVNLSRFHLARLFKGTLGISPHSYILRSKIEYAKSFMKKGKGAILDAAYKLSFSDQSHFTKTFRKYTGVTPKAFLAS